MDVVERIQKLPVELQLIVLMQTVHAPKVHFLKPFKTYNGGLYNQPQGFIRGSGNGEPGVEEVSPQSGASKLAKLFKEISEGKSSFPSNMGAGCVLLRLVLSFSLDNPKIDRRHKILTFM